MNILNEITKLQAEYNEMEAAKNKAHERMMEIKSLMRKLLTINGKASKVLNREADAV